MKEAIKLLQEHAGVILANKDLFFVRTYKNYTYHGKGEEPLSHLYQLEVPGVLESRKLTEEETKKALARYHMSLEELNIVNTEELHNRAPASAASLPKKALEKVHTR